MPLSAEPASVPVVPVTTMFFSAAAPVNSKNRMSPEPPLVVLPPEPVKVEVSVVPVAALSPSIVTVRPGPPPMTATPFWPKPDTDVLTIWIAPSLGPS